MYIENFWHGCEGNDITCYKLLSGQVQYMYINNNDGVRGKHVLDH